jgi:hypothetical protein
MANRPRIKDAGDLLGNAIQANLGEPVQVGPEGEGVNESVTTHTQSHSHTVTQTLPQSHTQINVEAMFETNPVFFTVRLPEAARDWISDEVYRLKKMKKKGVSQQSIVEQAVKEFIVRRLEE